MKAIIAKLKRQPVVESIIQFGSSVERKDFRDIDLCLFTTRPLTLREKLALQRDIPEKFDIAFYEDLPLHIKKEVLTKGKIVYTKAYDNILKELFRVDLEYPRYQAFLDEYHQEMVAAL